MTFMSNACSRRKLVLAGLVGSLVLIWSVVQYRSHLEWMSEVTDSVTAMQWEGFGPEKGLYNFTVVTAMLDIGRGKWKSQSRSYNTYLLYMQRLLRMDMNLLIFVDKKGKPFVDWMRRGRENKTKVILTSLKESPYYKLRPRIAEIMESEEYRKDNELYEKKLCESFIPEYDILQLSKLYLMDRATREDPFKTSYFVWIDAGYGHGQDVYPHDGIWVPKHLFEHSQKVTFLERDPGVEEYRNSIPKLHKISINIVAGLFFAGGREAFQKLYRYQQAQVDEWMQNGIIDDDQTMYMMLYYRHPEVIRLISGDWYDVFPYFNKGPSERNSIR